MAKTVEELIEAFHMTWEHFPGPARLIDRDHHVIAANPVALKAGFAPGVVCAEVGAPESHRDCKMERHFATGKTQTDNAFPDKVRGWLPIDGFPDICVHFGLPIPKE